MKHVTLVHGFNVRDGGARSVDRLVPYIDAVGYEVDVDEADYGFFNLFMVRFTKSRLRQRVLYRLAKAFEHTDAIITHSNGANFATQALDMLDPAHNNTKTVIHISPALDRNTPIPLAVKRQLVLYTPHDWAVRISSLLLFHPWGAMGAVGYKGCDNRNTNRRCQDIKGHSGWFLGQHVETTWHWCKEFINR